MDKTKPDAVVLIDPAYYKHKESIIEQHFNVVSYAALYDELVGTVFKDKKVLSFTDFSEIPANERPEKVIIALPFDYYFKKIISFLLKCGFSKRDIVFTFILPDVVQSEQYMALYWGPEVSYGISDDGNVFCLIEDKKY